MKTLDFNKDLVLIKHGHFLIPTNSAMCCPVWPRAIKSFTGEECASSFRIYSALHFKIQCMVHVIDCTCMPQKNISYM